MAYGDYIPLPSGDGAGGIAEVSTGEARATGPLCEDVARGFCAASVDGYCIGGYGVDDLLRCHG